MIKILEVLVMREDDKRKKKKTRISVAQKRPFLCITWIAPSSYHAEAASGLETCLNPSN
jgi:hypothetical protein